MTLHDEYAEIGREFMEKLPPNYWYNDSPIEYVTNLENKIQDLKETVTFIANQKDKAGNWAVERCRAVLAEIGG